MSGRGGRPLVACGLLLLATLLAYLPALSAGWVWDDDAHVTANPLLRVPGGLARIWLEPSALPQYYPLVHTTFWLEYRLWRLDPAGYHAVNILLHAASAMLLCLLLRRLAIPGAWFAAALFALHPLHVESVAWVTERKNVLSGLLYVAALLVFARDFELDAPAPGADRSGAWLRGSLLFLAALLSKTVTATLPVTIAILVWWRRGRWTGRELARLTPLVALGATFGLITAALEKHHVGAEGADWALGFLDRIVLAGRGLWFYLGKLAWPADLSFVYPRVQPSASDPLAWLYPGAAAALAAVLWALRARIGRGPLAALLHFAVALFPALGFFDVFPFRYSFVASHFAYLASLGPIVLAAALATRLATRPAARIPAALGPIAAGAVLLVLATLTWREARTYSRAESLWRATLARNPGAWLAHNNLGNILLGRRDPVGAQTHFEAALRLAPENTEARANLATALGRQGRGDQALALLEEALRQQPGSAELWYNLGIQHARARDLAAAERDFRRALELRPDHPEAHANLGNVLELTGRGDQAIEHWSSALRARPSLASAAYNLARAEQARGRLAPAAARLGELLLWHPDDVQARAALAELLEALGRHEEAAVERRRLPRPPGR